MWTIAAVTLLAFGACSSTATVTRWDHRRYEGRIEGSDFESVYVGDGHGVIHRVPRKDVADIDHPGNVQLTIGGVLLALSAATLVAASHSQQGQDDPLGAGYGLIAAIVLYGLPGAILAAYGGVTYGRSIQAASNFGEATQVPPTPLQMAPPRPAPSPTSVAPPTAPDQHRTVRIEAD